MRIEKPSVQSLFIEMYFNDTRLSSGTGFLVEAPGGTLLITNRHNVTGRHQDTGKTLSVTGGVPNKVRVWRNEAGNLGGWQPFDYSLLDQHDEPKWLEHPTLGADADFVAVRTDTPFGITNYPYQTETPEDEILLRPAETVSVIGFPFGQSAGGLLGIWVSGFIASEPDVDYNGKPQFLIDCRTRQGQSGSPVLAVRHGMVSWKNGGFVMGGNQVEFLGIYSGRINDQSDIGVVWKRRAIDELVQSVV